MLVFLDWNLISASTQNNSNQSNFHTTSVLFSFRTVFVVGNYRGQKWNLTLTFTILEKSFTNNTKTHKYNSFLCFVFLFGLCEGPTFLQVVFSRGVAVIFCLHKEVLEKNCD